MLLDPSKPEYLGAEVEHDVGKEYEKHVFRTPLACCIPRNVVHCPQITLKCEKPYGFIVLSLDAQHQTIVMPQRSTLDTTEGYTYDSYYRKLVFQKDIKAKTGPGNADALAWLRAKTSRTSMSVLPGDITAEWGIGEPNRTSMPAINSWFS